MSHSNNIKEIQDYQPASIENDLSSSGVIKLRKTTVERFRDRISEVGSGSPEKNTNSKSVFDVPDYVP